MMTSKRNTSSRPIVLSINNLFLGSVVFVCFYLILLSTTPLDLTPNLEGLADTSNGNNNGNSGLIQENKEKKNARRTSSSSSPAIPHVLYFTHKTNILETEDPPFIYDNVMNTIEAYRGLWKEPTADVVFLDDDMCREKIKASEPRLLSWFNREKLGMYKADICRVAALYLAGGYYFDVDIRVVEPIELADNVTFSSCREAEVHMKCETHCKSKSVEKVKYR